MRPTLFQGTVLTGDPRRPRTDAVLVGDGRILALGSDAVTAAGSPAQVEVSGALLPAFGDGHCHPIAGGLEQFGPAISTAATLPELLAEVARWAAEHPAEQWVRGASFDLSLAPGGVFDARWLDAVVPHRPVVLRAGDYHTLWVNSEALRRAGIAADTPEPRLGVIVRRPDGTPVGTLREWHACDLVLDVAPRRDDAELDAALRYAGRRMAAAGVVWWQDAWIDPGSGALEAYHRVGADLPVRADLALRADPDRWRDQVAEFIAIRAQFDPDGPVTARTVKFFTDGVLESGTGALLAPYADGSGSPGPHGMAVWQSTELRAAARAFDAAGFGLHLHCIGDAAARTALDALESVIAGGGPARPPVIAHCQLIDPVDLPRFAALGVIANFEPLWSCLEPGMTELTLPRLGPERGERQYPMATLSASGTQLSFGSDWPVSDERPLAGIATALTRQTPSGDPPGGWTGHERLDLSAALRAYSAGVAAQAAESASWGRIAVGMRADLVELAADPSTVEPLSLPTVAVVRTWRGGTLVHG